MQFLKDFEAEYKEFMGTALIRDYAVDVSPTVAAKCESLKKAASLPIIDEIKESCVEYRLRRRTCLTLVAQALMGTATVCGNKCSFGKMLMGSGGTVYTKINFLFKYIERMLAEAEAQDEYVTFKALRYNTLKPRAIHSKNIEPDLVIPCDLGAAAKWGAVPPARVHHSNCDCSGPLFGSALTEEELPFLTHPEYIVSLMLFGTLDCEEVVIAEGMRQFSSHTVTADGVISFSSLPAGKVAPAPQTFVRVGLVFATDYKSQFTKESVMLNVRKYVTAFSGMLDDGHQGCVAAGPGLIVTCPAQMDPVLHRTIISIAASLTGKKIMVDTQMFLPPMGIGDAYRSCINGGRA
jgi:hypothetical protein